MPTDDYCEDPVLAYDRLALVYGQLAERRARYLAAVEREILARITPGRASLLDVGAGDGSRALRIASEVGIRRIVLVEPSEKMLPRSVDGVEIWRSRAEELGNPPSPCTFAVITCLWNVLGHVRGTEARLHAVQGIANLLAEQGKFFFDINNRYNARSYGSFATVARMARDLLLPGTENGDVRVHWNAGSDQISTYGHLFTHKEIVRLARSAGLKLQERIVIDYDNGQVRRNAFEGNLLYAFQRA